MAHAFQTYDAKSKLTRDARLDEYKALFQKQVAPLLELVKLDWSADVPDSWKRDHFAGKSPSRLYLRIVTCLLGEEGRWSHTTCGGHVCDNYDESYLIPFTVRDIRFFYDWISEGHLPTNTSAAHFVLDQL